MKASEAFRLTKNELTKKDKRQLKRAIRGIRKSAKRGYVNEWFLRLEPRVIYELEGMGYEVKQGGNKDNYRTNVKWRIE